MFFSESAESALVRRWFPVSVTSATTSRIYGPIELRDMRLHLTAILPSAYDGRVNYQVETALSRQSHQIGHCYRLLPIF